jgi:hypothetical protein
VGAPGNGFGVATPPVVAHPVSDALKKAANSTRTSAVAPSPFRTFAPSRVTTVFLSV